MEYRPSTARYLGGTQPTIVELAEALANQMIPRTDVRVIVVSYNTRELTLACLRSINQESGETFCDLVIVDNASNDGSQEAIRVEFPEWRLIVSKQNLGFGAANNLAASNCRARYILLVNSDTVMLERAIPKIVSFADRNPAYGIYGGRTVFGDGTLNPTSCWGRPTPWSLLCRCVGLSVLFPGSRVFDQETYGGWERDTVREVDIVTGCFLLIKKALWDELGGFLPEFFMYGEDADLCLRAKRLGYRSVICPEARLIHYGGQSEVVPADKLVKLLNGQRRLYRRHWGRVWSGVAPYMLAVWVFSRLVVWTMIGFMRTPQSLTRRATLRSVWTRRAAWMRDGGSESGVR